MKTCNLFFFFAVIFFVFACSPSNNIADQQEDSSVILENDLMICYNISTKSDETEVLIKIKDYPELDVYCFGYNSTKSNALSNYDNVAYCVSGGNRIATLYFSVEETTERRLFRYNIDNVGEDSFFPPSSLTTKGAMGQYMADCLQDAYTNHGWASVFATVATAFCPYVVCGFVGACVAHYEMDNRKNKR